MLSFELSRFTMIVITLVLILLITFFLYVRHCHAYWEKRKIPTLPPRFFVGNIWKALLGTENFMECVVQAYTTFKDYKYVGFYKCLTPALIISDPELIGKVMIKDFSHFEDNAIEVSEDADILMGKNLFVLKGHHWRSIKSLMSPMFTAGKLKHIYPLVDDTAKKLVVHLHKRIADGRHLDVDAKYLAHQFTTENVASCAFGVNAQAFESENSEFVNIARIFGTPSFLQALKINLAFMIPSLSKILSFAFFTKYVQDYLLDVVTQTLRYRKENNIMRNDYLDLISQLKEKSKEYPFDDKDVTAQAAAFFGDGIETSSIVICYTLFEIAKHPEVQERLREEISDTKQRHSGEITYEGLLEMPYLDSVIDESLRLHPPLLVMFKTCTKTYQFPPPKDNVPGVTVHPGDTLFIPAEGLHHNAEFFPEPEKFIPERFSKENKGNIQNYTYLPFGEGPRVCVGLRFGVLQVKMAVVHILNHFKVDISKKMIVPLKLDPSTFLRMPVGGFWFDFNKIQQPEN